MTLLSDAVMMRDLVGQLAQLIYEISDKAQAFVVSVPEAEQRAAQLDELLERVNQLEQKKRKLEEEITALGTRRDEILAALEKLRLKLG